ncbi:DOPA 4,5-dioxygenase family protein [Rhodovibrionaceae bacterium A322]
MSQDPSSPSAAPTGAASHGKDPAADIRGYHAHIYFGEESKATAWALKEEAGQRFDVVLGRFHERPVGPHPQWSIQLAFEPEVFARIVPWLMLNRQGLTVFIHPETGDDLVDHTDHVLWLGDSDSLKTELFG